MVTTETPILRRILLCLGSLRAVRVFRNNVGNAYQGTPISGNRPGQDLVLRNWRRIQYGLFPGSGDLIGWRSVVITPEMVGTTIAQFVSIEVKTETGRVAHNQRVWVAQVNYCGGIAGVVRSEADALKLINGGNGATD